MIFPRDPPISCSSVEKLSAEPLIPRMLATSVKQGLVMIYTWRSLMETAISLHLHRRRTKIVIDVHRHVQATAYEFPLFRSSHHKQPHFLLNFQNVRFS